MNFDHELCGSCKHFETWTPHSGFNWHIRKAFDLEKSPREYMRKKYRVHYCKFNESNIKENRFAFSGPQGFRQYSFKIESPDDCAFYLEYIIKQQPKEEV